MIKRVLFALTVSLFFYWIIISQYKNYNVWDIIVDMFFLLIVYWLSIGLTYGIAPLKNEVK